jgi:hypothetical protein
MPPPDAWGILVNDLWQLPAADANAFWMALAHAKRSRPTALRQQLALTGYLHITDRFWERFCAPAVLFAVVEDLVGERQLSRQRATRIEDCFLRQLDRHGCWRGTVWDGTTRQTTLPPDIVTLAETGQP